jgi:hypothetical protein
LESGVEAFLEAEAEAEAAAEAFGFFLPEAEAEAEWAAGGVAVAEAEAFCAALLTVDSRLSSTATRTDAVARKRINLDMSILCEREASCEGRRERV